ncbi:MAG: Asp-tRNA(Asn)/Glu-tRNA(Gln) amidotransferase GatCAB subunit B, partial [Pseudohongiellaceae bacterium]
IDEYKLSEYDALVLANDLATANYFEAVVAECGNAKLSANWVSVDLQAYLNETEIPVSESPVTPQQLGGLINKITDNTISSKIAKTVFEAMLAGEGNAEEIIEAKGLKQVTDSSAIEAMVDAVIANNPEQVKQYRSGKEKVFGFFVGQIMKESKGKANPGQVNQILKEKLSN